MYITLGKFENSFTPFIPASPNVPTGELWDKILISHGISSLSEEEKQKVKEYFQNGSIVAIIEPIGNDIQETIDYLVSTDHKIVYSDKPDILCLYQTQKGIQFRGFFSSAYDVSTDFATERQAVEAVSGSSDSPSTSNIANDIAPPEFVPNQAAEQAKIASNFLSWLGSVEKESAAN